MSIDVNVTEIWSPSTFFLQRGVRAVQERSAVVLAVLSGLANHICVLGMGAPAVESFCTRFEHLLVPYWRIALEYRSRQYTGRASIDIYRYAQRAGASITYSSQTPPVQYTRTGTGTIFRRSATDR
jgi:hypothetical protein